MEQIKTDEIILKKVCKEMGIELSNNFGEATIDGIKASDYFKSHSIFENLRLKGQENDKK